MIPFATNSTAAISQVSDFPVGWATLFLAIATFVVALFALLNLREAAKQRKALEDQARAQREQTDSQVIPRVSVYQGVPTESRQSAPLARYVVVENAAGGGPAMDINVTVRNVTRSSPLASTHFDIINPGEDKGAGVPGGPQPNDRIEANVRFKDVLGKDYQKNVAFEYQGSPGRIF